jgi:hypothetical protein
VAHGQADGRAAHVGAAVRDIGIRETAARLPVILCDVM